MRRGNVLVAPLFLGCTYLFRRFRWEKRKKEFGRWSRRISKEGCLSEKVKSSPASKKDRARVTFLSEKQRAFASQWEETYAAAKRSDCRFARLKLFEPTITQKKDSEMSMTQQTYSYPRVTGNLGQPGSAVRRMCQKLEVDKPVAEFLVDGLVSDVKSALYRKESPAINLRSFSFSAYRTNGSGPEVVGVRINVKGNVIERFIPTGTMCMVGKIMDKDSTVGYIQEELQVPRHVASYLVSSVMNVVEYGSSFNAFTVKTEELLTPDTGEAFLEKVTTVHLHAGKNHVQWCAYDER